jgi:hypothetical protein
MSKLKFSDGEEFDVSGEMRAELRNEEAANKIIDSYKK